MKPPRHANKANGQPQLVWNRAVLTIFSTRPGGFALECSFDDAARKALEIFFAAEASPEFREELRGALMSGANPMQRLRVPAHVDERAVRLVDEFRQNAIKELRAAGRPTDGLDDVL